MLLLGVGVVGGSILLLLLHCRYDAITIAAATDADCHCSIAATMLPPPLRIRCCYYSTNKMLLLLFQYAAATLPILLLLCRYD